MVEFHCCDESRRRGETFLDCFFDFLHLDLAESFYLQECFASGTVDGLDEWLGWGMAWAWNMFGDEVVRVEALTATV